MDKAITILIDTLNSDREEIKTLTKLTSTDIDKQTELCVRKPYSFH